MIVTALYCLVAAAAVGAMPWIDFTGIEAVLNQVLTHATGASVVWSILLSLGALVAISSVVLSVMYGQTRVVFAMACDGLLPTVFSRVEPTTGSPRANVLIISMGIAVLAGTIPLGALADATSIGTLFAFGLVNIAVLVLRHSHPDLPRSFRAPLAPLTPLLGVGFCLWMMLSLDMITWLVFGGWMLAGLVLYLSYGRRHSRLAHTPQQGTTPPHPTP